MGEKVLNCRKKSKNLIYPAKRRGLSLILALIFLLSFTACGSRGEEEAPALLVPVALTEACRPVERRDIGEVKFLKGTVTAETYPVFTGKSITLYELKVDPGDMVRKGDVIATGDTRSLDSQISSYTKQLGVLQLQRSTSDTISKKREEQLKYKKKAAEETGFTGLAAEYGKEIKKEQENRRYSLAETDAAIASVNKQITELKKNRNGMTFTAPHDGMVTYLRDISSSTYVSANENIAVISDFDVLYIEADIITKSYQYEDYAEKYIMADGKKVPVEEIDYSSAELSYADNMGIYPAVRFSAEGVRLEPGATVPIYFVKNSSPDVLAVGNDSVYTEDEESYCYVKGADGQKEKRTIELGMKDSLYSEVLSGLSEGEMVYYDSTSVIPVKYREYTARTGDYVEENYSEYITELLTGHDICIAEIEGSVQEVISKVGDDVEKGDEILKLEIPVNRGELAEARNSLADLEAGRKSQLAEFDRREKEIREELDLLNKETVSTDNSVKENKDREKTGKENSDKERSDKERPDNEKTDIENVEIAGKPGEAATPEQPVEVTVPENPEEVTAPEEPVEEPASEDPADDTDVDAEMEAKREKLYRKECLQLELEILAAEKKLATENYTQSKAQLEERRKKLSGYGTDGTYTIKAKTSGKLGQSLPAVSTTVYTGQYLFTVNSPGGKLLRISMPKKRGQEAAKAAHAGQKILLKTDDREYTGTCVAENGYEDKVYLFTRDGDVHLTWSVPYSAGQTQQFFAKLDDESYFDGEELPSAVVSFQSVVIHGGITIPAKAVYTEKDAMSQETSTFVWKKTDTGLAKQKVTVFENSQFSEERLILSGLSTGDVIAVE